MNVGNYSALSVASDLADGCRLEAGLHRLKPTLYFVLTNGGIFEKQA